ncbi:MAG: formylmethanofuran dehydrogenase subunit E family protein, partial [Candidatus Omnitrophica bacterium]|nr:formylmethanofuran dehydrogenase subunit E family protein [Candidatus Omnitrophota bacterium]
MKISLKEAEKFHGHLGPWLVLGLLAGSLALKKLKSKKYFGIEVRVFGADRKPKSCLIDGLQLSSGATYGKGNIKKFKGKKINIVFLKNKQKLTLTLKDIILEKLLKIKSHRES